MNKILKPLLLLSIIASLCLYMFSDPYGAAAKNRRRIKNKKVDFADAEIFVEINDTDGDSGLQIFLDGEGWRYVNVYDPRGKKILKVKGSKGVAQTGLTEMFFESAEPGFDELPLEEFEKRFREGVYRFVGKTVEGDRIAGRATLTHTYPSAPVLLSPEEDSVQDPNNTVIMWEAVPNPAGSEITRYEIIVSDESVSSPLEFIAHVPATETSVSVPPEFLIPGREYKYEVIAYETSGNKTLSESTFIAGP